MKSMLIIGSIIFPLIMFFSAKNLLKLQVIYNLLAIIAGLVFGNIASISIYSIIKNETVFTPAIHAVFLNPLFLIAGSYLGLYALYRLLLLNINL